MKTQNLADQEISSERRNFIDAAFQRHLAAEIAGNVPAIIATYADNGHLNFNGVIYDTPEKLAAFHIGFGFSGAGMLKNMQGEILNKTYTHNSVAVEHIVSAVVEIPAGTPERPSKHRCLTIYQFDDEGKILSERAYNDTGALLPVPVVPRFSPQ